ncbi:MAG TPA: hypothetical protein VHW26_12130 [Solirubrobacteraceae bacterium]|nr:hypothetical protein [Solirubrobacteraceae bacterium]
MSASLPRAFAGWAVVFAITYAGLNIVRAVRPGGTRTGRSAPRRLPPAADLVVGDRGALGWSWILER